MDTVFLGPFLGELGWELSRWQGFCRFWSENKYKGKKIICASFPGRAPFYKDFASTFIELPEWFLQKGFDVDSYESVGITAKEYAELLQYFKQFYDPAKTEEIRTPRGYNFILPNFGPQKLIKLRPSQAAENFRESILGKNQYIVVSPRGRARASFRNWPEEYWQTLIEDILKNYPGMIVVLTGAPNGSCLVDYKAEGVINLIKAIDTNLSIDVSIALLNNALMSITSQSGSTHLSLQSCCPSMMIGHEQQRHTHEENYLRTSCMFIYTERYDVHPYKVSHYFGQFLEDAIKYQESEEN